MMLEKYQSALTFIDPYDRDVWLKCGMAIKAALGEIGFAIWDSWSRGASNYDKSSALSVWRSIRRNHGITEATLFKYAIDGGWNHEQWQTYEPHRINYERRKKEIDAETRELENNRMKAAQKAEWILSQCKNDISQYLASKGFPEMCFNVWKRGDNQLLCVPMRINKKISGVQLIQPDGSKIFLRHSNTNLATFDIGTGATIFLVEGLASGLSMQKIAATLKIPYTVRVCFSAGNMSKIAQIHKDPILICDNDKSGVGQRVGQESGKRFYVPPVAGMDINDEYIKSCFFTVSQKIKKLIYTKLK